MSPPPRDSSAAAILPTPDEEDPLERAFRLAPVVYDEEITDEERGAMRLGAAKARDLGHRTTGRG
jgi:hypothetical protein